MENNNKCFNIAFNNDITNLYLYFNFYNFNFDGDITKVK